MAHTSAIELERRPQRTGLVGPTVLIAAGIVLLLNNLGLVSWGIWASLMRFWPVLLVAVGLDIIFGRRSTWASALIALAALLALALLAGPWGSWSIRGAGLATSTTISQGLDGARRASVELAPGVGTLRVSAMAEPDGLIVGTAETYANERLDRAFSVYDGTAFFALRSEQIQPWQSTGGWDTRTWDLQLNPEVPTRLMIAGGVGRTEADLSKLNLMSLDVNAGVGDVRLTLPATGRFSVQINAGVGDVEVTIPPGMAARITVNGGLGQTRVLGTYERSGDTYTTPGYATAEHRIDLMVEGGVGSVTVR